MGYVNNLETDTTPAGIHYRPLSGTGWSPAALIYASKYFRSLAPENANVQLGTSSVNDQVNVYIVWDDRAQRRIFLKKSLDGGERWEGISQVRGPEDFPGVELPYNIDLGLFEDQVQLIWQAGIPGSQCAQYSQWSTDGGKQFGQPVKMLDDFALCPQSGQFILSDSDFSVVLLNTNNDHSLMAWNGSSWSIQALYPPKRFFGAARNIEERGSLTIIATCLVDTGSRMDDVVYEEFKGTGNMELHLSRRLQERRVFPAIDIERSSTRRAELLLGPDITPRVWLMRRMYDQMVVAPPHGAGLDPSTATEAILQRMARTSNNMDFMETLTEG